MYQEPNNKYKIHVNTKPSCSVVLSFMLSFHCTEVPPKKNVNPWRLPNLPAFTTSKNVQKGVMRLNIIEALSYLTQASVVSSLPLHSM